MLNRAVAASKVHGPERAIDEIRHTLEGGSLNEYPLAHAVLGDLEVRRDRPIVAAGYFARALALTASSPERSLFASRLRECAPQQHPA